jgi:hypothetical protein
MNLVEKGFKFSFQNANKQNNVNLAKEQKILIKKI